MPSVEGGKRDDGKVLRQPGPCMPIGLLMPTQLDHSVHTL